MMKDSNSPIMEKVEKLLASPDLAPKNEQEQIEHEIIVEYIKYRLQRESNELQPTKERLEKLIKSKAQIWKNSETS